MAYSVKNWLMENHQTTLMGELFAVLKESLRKQAFSVILLICGCAGLWLIWRGDRKDLQAQITALTAEISDCRDARLSLSVEVATLKERLAVLEAPVIRTRRN